MTTSSIVSLVIVAGIVVFAIIGGYKGAIRQIGSVAAFLLGFLGAGLFGASLCNATGLPSILCYTLVFAIVFILIVLLARILKLTVNMLLLGPVDRLIGALIGVAKWLLLATVMLNLYVLCGAPTEPLSATPTQWVIQLLPRLFGIAQQYI